MAILFDCPFCSYEKEVPDSYKGKKIKCPRCLATITLGVPQPTALTALPLPEEDESSSMEDAIEVDAEERNSLFECPICLALINSEELQCLVYKTYHEEEGKVTENFDGKKAEKLALDSYQKVTQKAKTNLKLSMVSLVPGIGFLLGPIMLLQTQKITPMLCENLETDNKHRLNTSMMVNVIGIISSVFALGSLLFWLQIFP